MVERITVSKSSNGMDDLAPTIISTTLTRIPAGAASQIQRFGHRFERMFECGVRATNGDIASPTTLLTFTTTPCPRARHEDVDRTCIGKGVVHRLGIAHAEVTHFDVEALCCCKQVITLGEVAHRRDDVVSPSSRVWAQRVGRSRCCCR
jgi:hypothetical protein